MVEEGNQARFEHLARSSDEFLATSGAAGLGRVALQDEAVFDGLHELAADPRWRVREGVAIGLQRFGREDMARLLKFMRTWAREGPYLQRAVVAALCEPPLLKERADAVAVLGILDRITGSLASSTDRRTDGFRVLRQALGYGWSVAAAAAPEAALPYLEKWMRSTDKDVEWVMKSNLGKSRMNGLRARLIAGVAP